jgi:muramoyltetrapeptide carboxypeptidase
LYLPVKYFRMEIPPYLKQGDKIRIVAPAGKIKKEFVQNGKLWLESQGYRVILGDYTLNAHNQFAGRDTSRLQDLQEALDDPETSVILCARGGYGTIRIVDRLNFASFLKHPKWIVGFSDITVLHSQVNKLGVASVHGPMVRHLPKPGGRMSESVQSLFSLLKGEKQQYKAENHSLNRTGKAEAELIGGNLSILSSLTGTPYKLNFSDKILFIEDIGEYHYHIDRMMHSLKLSGQLSRLAGLVVGGFTRMKDNRKEFGMNACEIISEAVKDYDYPVCFGFPAGHDKKNLALALGVNWKLEVSRKSSVLNMME